MLGSGKSTICNILKEKYGYEIFTMGIILRSLAEKQGMSTLEFNDYINKNDNNVDDIIDSESKRIAKVKNRTECCIRFPTCMAFVPDSLKVYLDVSPDEAAKRVSQVNDRVNENYTSNEEAKQALIMRSNIECERFNKLYGVNLRDFNNYDVVVDTTALTPLEVSDIIINAANKHA
jgi:Cytidylate kinase